MTLQQAYEVLRALERDEAELGEDGNASLDQEQFDALAEVLALVQDVIENA